MPKPGKCGYVARLPSCFPSVPLACADGIFKIFTGGPVSINRLPLPLPGFAGVLSATCDHLHIKYPPPAHHPVAHHPETRSTR
jgi:hypothetical protein